MSGSTTCNGLHGGSRLSHKHSSSAANFYLYPIPECTLKPTRTSPDRLRRSIGNPSPRPSSCLASAFGGSGKIPAVARAGVVLATRLGPLLLGPALEWVVVVGVAVVLHHAATIPQENCVCQPRRAIDSLRDCDRAGSRASPRKREAPPHSQANIAPVQRGPPLTTPWFRERPALCPSLSASPRLRVTLSDAMGATLNWFGCDCSKSACVISNQRMPRWSRVVYPGAIYHVPSRGDRRVAAFLDDVDQQDLNTPATDAAMEVGWQAHVYQQMSNHRSHVSRVPQRLGPRGSKSASANSSPHQWSQQQHPAEALFPAKQHPRTFSRQLTTPGFDPPYAAPLPHL